MWHSAPSPDTTQAGRLSTSTLGVDDLRSLAQSWMLALRAERKSPQTLKNYGDGG